MTNQNVRLTTSNIKYLIGMWELGAAEKGVRSIDLAKKMNTSKPSTHAMVLNLCDKGLVLKDESAVLHLTEKGAVLSEEYARCYTPLLSKLQMLLQLSADDCRDAACSILTQVQEHLPEFAATLNV